jgi:hypothetical protein
MGRTQRAEEGRALEVGTVVEALRALRDRLLAGGAISAELALAVVEESRENWGDNVQ